MRGEIQQVPPMVSAVKVDGERLHAKARRGEVVDRDPRTVTIHDLVLEDFRPGEHPEVSFLVTCSAGTYVRTIAHDLGQELGVGGSLTALRRIANGPFTVEEAMPLDEVRERGEAATLREALLTPASALRGLRQHAVDGDVARRLTHGQRVPVGLDDGPVAIVHADRLVGTFEVTDGVAFPDVVLLRPEDLT